VGPGRRAVLLPFLCLTLAASACWAQTWYVSNRLGMKLEPIPRYRADEFAYVLSETTREDITVLTLYHRGEEAGAAVAAQGSGSPLEGLPMGATEVTRWEREKTAEGVRETVYERGTLERVSLLKADGRVTSETTYTDGQATERMEYRYAGGYLRSVVARPPGGGDVLWEVRYDLTPDGRLRASRRTGSQPEIAAFNMGGGRLEDEYLATPGRTVILRYDTEGRRVVWEVYGEDKLQRAAYDDFDPETGKPVATKDLTGELDRTERSYDEEGRVVQELTYHADAVVATTTHTYDDKGHLKASQRRSDAGIESWSYRYDDSGELEVEEYRDRGTMRMRIVHTGPDERYEEIVQSLRSSLRIYFVEDRKVREDFVRDGKVIRSREVGGEGS
jgi:antitoxin component YwqK of YwqJK toxin-antitoxin module